MNEKNTQQQKVMREWINTTFNFEYIVLFMAIANFVTCMFSVIFVAIVIIIHFLVPKINCQPIFLKIICV